MVVYQYLWFDCNTGLRNKACYKRGRTHHDEFQTGFRFCEQLQCSSNTPYRCEAPTNMAPLALQRSSGVKTCPKPVSSWHWVASRWVSRGLPGTCLLWAYFSDLPLCLLFFHSSGSDQAHRHLWHPLWYLEYRNTWVWVELNRLDHFTWLSTLTRTASCHNCEGC